MFFPKIINLFSMRVTDTQETSKFSTCLHHSVEPQTRKVKHLKFVHITTESLHTHTQGSFKKIQSLYVPQCRGHIHTRGTLKFTKFLSSKALSSHFHTRELENFSMSLHTTVPNTRKVFLPQEISQKKNLFQHQNF